MNMSADEKMTPARWQQIKAVLADALDCASEQEREILLARDCTNDPDLRREVESLLAYNSTIAMRKS